jgi:hypothetical protein
MGCRPSPHKISLQAVAEPGGVLDFLRPPFVQINANRDSLEVQVSFLYCENSVVDACRERYGRNQRIAAASTHSHPLDKTGQQVRSTKPRFQVPDAKFVLDLILFILAHEGRSSRACATLARLWYLDWCRPDASLVLPNSEKEPIIGVIFHHGYTS